jgi:hypothetical protein
MNWKILIICLLVLPPALLGQKVVTLEETLGPAALYVYNNNAYIQEGGSILVYDLKDFKLKKRIGSKGSGPGEFKLVPYVKRLFLFFQKDKLLVCHLGRVSYFTLEGDYISERKHLVMLGWGSFHPLESKYLALDIHHEEKEPYNTIGIYDSQLNLEKVLLTAYEKEKYLKKNWAFDSIKYGTMGKWAFIVPSSDFVIDVYDESGKKCHSIRKTVKKIPVTEDDKKYHTARYTDGNGDRKMGALIAKGLIFPKVFPAIRYLFFSSQKIYVLTYRRKGQHHQCFVFNPDGRQLKETWVPFYNPNPLAEMNFFSIANGNVYQLVENEDEESWELHIDPIK